MAGTLRALAATLVLGAVTPLALAAQDRTETVLRGTVVDTDGRPLSLALVGLVRSDDAVMTDSQGRFALEVGPARGYRIGVEQLGYHNAEIWVEAEDAAAPLIIALERDPIALEGLEVAVDRFERRRRFYPGIVRVVDQEELGFSAASTAYDIVRRSAPNVTACPYDLYEICTLRRGSRVRTLICIDERRAFGGRDELEHYRPEELYMIEVYEFGRAIRLYTRWYVDKVMKTPRPLTPVEFGC